MCLSYKEQAGIFLHCGVLAEIQVKSASAQSTKQSSLGDQPNGCGQPFQKSLLLNTKIYIGQSNMTIPNDNKASTLTYKASVSLPLTFVKVHLS